VWPARAKTVWDNNRNRTEHVRLAHQAVVAIAGVGMINRAEPRACGCSRQLNGQSCKVMASGTRLPTPGHMRLIGRTLNGCQTLWAEGQPVKDYSSNRTGENPPYGMNGGAGGNEVQGLMAFCHDARKGGYSGSHWPKHFAPPAYSTCSLRSLTSERVRIPPRQ
jgi:hypothetical protein